VPSLVTSFLAGEELHLPGGGDLLERYPYHLECAMNQAK
jgi:hypothetical protein